MLKRPALAALLAALLWPGTSGQEPRGALEAVRIESETSPDVRRIFHRLRAGGEMLSVSEMYRAYFNRAPELNTDRPMLSRLSQGRYPFERENNRLSQARACKSCHEREHAAWSHSLHSQAFTNIRFREAFEREPNAWCLNCHAPFWYDKQRHAEPSGTIVEESYIASRTLFIVRSIGSHTAYRPSYSYADVDTPLNREGVNCAACHVRNGVIYGARKPSLVLLALAASGIVHDTGSDPSLRTQDFCAGCHEFAFPASYAPVVSYTSRPMQSTVSQYFEVAQSARNGQCVDCHMGEGLHASSTISNPDPARRSAFLQVRFYSLDEPAGLRLLVNFRADRIGHHLPTGDLFRQIRVLAFDESGTEILRHNIGLDVDSNTFQVHSDTRLKVKGRQGINETLSFRPRARPVRCTADYLFEGKIDHLHTLAGGPDRRISLYDGPCR